jgi:nicotinate phosphoribosyltransferase
MMVMDRIDRNLMEGILFTDQYQLTMAQLYFKLGLHEMEAQFEHFFRSYPNYGTHEAGYCINAGLEWFINWMINAKFSSREINILRTQKTPQGKNLFEEKFLKWLQDNGNFDGISIAAIPEGRVVHPQVPLTVIRGPMAMAQILETVLLNQLNYQTLIATKASRIKLTGQNQLLLEFGTRRAHEFGANAGVRAALIGGADFTSNVAASYFLGYEPKGTHSHAMVQLFLALGMDELDAFKAFADLYPNNCILLVDTINTLESGIPNAIKVFETLRNRGYKPLAIRLDSGDLAFLSIQAARMLNTAGFDEVKIVLSNELDEMNIWQIITQIQEDGPQYGINPDSLIKRLVYGVGTRLITSGGDSALSGVYKLTSVFHNKKWLPTTKLSENISKSNIPGNKKIWRIYDKRNKATADLVALDKEAPQRMKSITLIHPTDPTKSRIILKEEISYLEPMLIQIIHKGNLVYPFPSLEKIRNLRKKDIDRLDPGVKRLIHPHIYHVSVSERVNSLKAEIAKKITNQ